MKEHIDKEINRTKTTFINKETANNILLKLHEELPKDSSMFTLKFLMTITNYTYATIRRYIFEIINYKPSLITRHGHKHYILNVRNKKQLHVNDIVFPDINKFGCRSNRSKLILEKVYEVFKDKTFTMKDIALEFDVKYGTARRWLTKIINTKGLEKILDIQPHYVILFSFNNDEMKKLGF